MDDKLKEALRLLCECCDELRLHDMDYDHVTNPELKKKVLEFMKQNGFITQADSPNTYNKIATA